MTICLSAVSFLLALTMAGVAEGAAELPPPKSLGDRVQEAIAKAQSENQQKIADEQKQAAQIYAEEDFAQLLVKEFFRRNQQVTDDYFPVVRVANEGGSLVWKTSPFVVANGVFCYLQARSCGEALNRVTGGVVELNCTGATVEFNHKIVEFPALPPPLAEAAALDVVPFDVASQFCDQEQRAVETERRTVGVTSSATD